MWNPFKEVADNWKKHNEAVKAQERQERHEAEVEVEKLNTEMTQKFCPLVNGDCRKTCVHFKPGYVFEMETADYEKYFIAHKPKCRMWRKS